MADFKKDIIEQIEKTWEREIDLRYIERDFDLKGLSRDLALRKIFELIENGDLVMVGKNKYTTLKYSGYLRGIISSTKKSYAFLNVEGREDDLFILSRDLNGALNGDLVLAKEKRLQSRKAAVVFKILKRKVKTFVGTYKKAQGGGFVTPDDDKLNVNVFIKSTNSKNAQTGEKVYVKITSYNGARGKVEGEVIEVLGSPEFKGVDILSVIRNYDLFEEFPYNVLREAYQMPKEVDRKRYPKRKVFEGNIVTIDGEDARDFDDAVSIEKTETGYTLYVHIADVSEYVLEGSELDREAYKRGTSVYFPDRVLPMLPKELSNGICSLNPHVDRLALSCKLNFDKSANLIDGDVFECIIKSKHRMTYTSVSKIFNGDEEECKKYADMVDDLKLMKELSEKLAKKRTARGAIDFDIPEVQIDVDENGKTKDIYKRPREASHRLIESFMIAANEFIAEKFCKLEVPFVYRVHETPDPQKVNLFVEFAAGFGEVLKIKGDELSGTALQKFLDTVSGKPYGDALNKLALRTMQKARYLELCSGHFGLGSEFYCHFTSPIRRYPDLICHRIIKMYLNGLLTKSREVELDEFVKEASENCSERERLAEKAEREVDEMKIAEFMQKFIGEEFDGVITGVTNFGVFVGLENTAEGLIRIENLPKDSYIFVENKFMLKGKYYTYRLGDKIRVKLINASPITKQIDFEHVDKNLKKID